MFTSQLYPHFLPRRQKSCVGKPGYELIHVVAPTQGNETAGLRYNYIRSCTYIPPVFAFFTVDAAGG